jgi:hypothetical protein
MVEVQTSEMGAKPEPFSLDYQGLRLVTIVTRLLCVAFEATLVQQ